MIASTDAITYQQMVDAVTAIRSLGPKQESFELKNIIGQRERTKILFPNLVISEWVEEGAVNSWVTQRSANVVARCSSSLLNVTSLMDVLHR